MKDLKDKWVLITGAASGIGRCMALEFAGEGSNVVIADINEEGMEKVAAKVEDKGVKALTVRADMSDPESVASLARDALDQAGRVDVLVNNAGIMILSDVKDSTLEEWDKVLGINLVGPVHLIHQLLPQMIERGSGHIVNIASLGGLVAMPGMASYTVSKQGMVGLSGALRAELWDKGIGVTVVCPGFVKTPIIETSQLKGFSDEVRQQPSIMMITPEKVARDVVKAVKKNRGRIIPSSVAQKLLWWINRVSPGAVEYVIRKMYQSWKRTPA